MLTIAAPYRKPTSVIKRFFLYSFPALLILFFCESIAHAHDHMVASGRKAACFLAETFPTVDAPGIEPAVLKESLHDFDVE